MHQPPGRANHLCVPHPLHKAQEVGVLGALGFLRAQPRPHRLLVSRQRLALLLQQRPAQAAPRLKETQRRYRCHRRCRWKCRAHQMHSLEMPTTTPRPPTPVNMSRVAPRNLSVERPVDMFRKPQILKAKRVMCQRSLLLECSHEESGVHGRASGQDSGFANTRGVV